MRSTLLFALPAIAAATLLTACGGSGDDGATAEVAPAEADGQRFPDVIAAVATPGGDGWTFDVTISSPYDTPERYADAWRVVAPDGAVLGVRELSHDHQFEQPFTRSLAGVEIPDDVEVVTVEARDSVNGWGGASLELTPDR